MAKKEPIQVDRAKLLNAMANAFNESELQNLCYELDIDYEDLKPGGKSDKARELILYCQRRNRLDDLLALCQQKRPHVGWAAVRQPTATVGDPGPVVRQEPADIFLSYSRKDSDIKDRLAQDLRQAGLSVWTDDGLEPGDPSWEQAIQSQLETAGCLVVLLSPDAKQSVWVGKELSYGALQGKRIFPAMVRGTLANAIPLTIVNAQFIDLRREYAGNFVRLRAALQKHLGRAPAEPEPELTGPTVVQTPPEKTAPRPPRVETVAERRPTGLAAPPDGVTIPYIVTGAPPLNIDWCWVPAGPFTMGRDRDPTALPIPIFKSDEEPAHIVDLEGFWLARYPVTNAQFRHFIEAGGYEDASWWSDVGWRWRQTWSVKQPKSWTKSKWNGDRQPVVGVSWYEANAFTRWAAETTGEPIRLPTEAAWEKAARGTDGRTYPWGNDQPTTKLGKFGRKVGNPPVGQYSPAGDGPYGNADLVSNVREWTSSLHKSYPYAADDGREDQAARDRRVMRGRDPRAHGPTSASFRWQSRPIDYDHEDGFRVACRSPSP